MAQKRLRLFAGPNGSGKTTIINKIPDNINLGFLINADDIEAELRKNGYFNLKNHQLKLTTSELQNFISNEGASSVKLPVNKFIDQFYISNQKVFIPENLLNSYIAADIAALLRIQHAKAGHSFTFETVLSHPSKIDFITTAKQNGYRIYLYYIATESADINVNRVNIRVTQKGHSVPEATIRARYKRSLALLYKTIKVSDRAFLFDNSGKESFFFAEITDGSDVEIKCDDENIPEWFFSYVLNR
ncbi:zeta toxin family protein [Marinilabilia rubra]|uniref:Zeta toxin n=1 Tax=Marinilabilia rubra TaxID=2162893 RepID=A0A2U2B3W7_9BACT|nr:zeta toxin family protein [Marinilabilia rubra]PWD97749.1 zeta toxin [Marinilabilia rubra]